MPLTLILTRHAKAVPARSGLDDHDRPLTEGGRRDARAVGRWLHARMAELALPAPLALVSSAQRTRETLDGIAAHAQIGSRQVEGKLYAAPAGGLLSAIRQVPQLPVALLIAHNPGIATLANNLLRQPAPSRLGRYAPGTTSIVAFDIESWADLRPGTGRFLAFASPNDLPAEDDGA
ncbi:SixA phosphatase family protein [Brevirhabdus sp.]|uniref:SixA phosphatase family protein n=1 Tax=Brevirhabdus sp. TaxID=2004514 RepID=UPI00405926E9